MQLSDNMFDDVAEEDIETDDENDSTQEEYTQINTPTSPDEKAAALILARLSGKKS